MAGDVKWAYLLQAVGKLYTMTAIPIIGLVAYGGTSESGLGPYLNEVELAFQSGRSILVYAALVLAYSIAWELFIREAVQAPILRFEKPLFVAASIFVPPVIYSMIHARYGLPQCVMAFSVGTICALFYDRTRSWTVLAAWHVLWNISAIVAGLIINQSL